MGGSRARADRVVLLIGVFKLTKAALLIAAALGWLLRGPAGRGVHWMLHAVKWAGALPGHHVVREVLGKLSAIGDHRLRQLAVAALAYAAVFAVEGFGLLGRKLWAEWLTVVVTASFLPLELYELAHRRGAGELVALLINTAIVVYLARRQLRARATGPATARRSRFRPA